MKSSDSPYHSLTSYSGHTKRIVIIAAAVLALIALIYYFSLPGHGDPTGIPPDLGIAVRDHFKENHNREVRQMRGFRCDRFDDGGKVIESPDATVEVVLEIRPSRQEEDESSDRWTALATYRGDRQWEINSIRRSGDPSVGGICRK